VNATALRGQKVSQPKYRLIAFVLFVTLVLGVMFAVIPSRSSAGSLSTGIIGMFPRQVGEFAYADL